MAGLMPPWLRQHFANDAKVESWIEKDFAKRTRLAARALDVDKHFGFWLPTRRLVVDGVTLMANKLAKWPPSGPVVEECRYPYLDQQFIEFIVSIPAAQLLRPGARRSLMRRSLAGIVPPEILSRRTKGTALRTPVSALRHDSDILDMALSSQLGYVNRVRFLDRFRQAQAGAEIHIVRMLKTVALEAWLRNLASRNLLVLPVGQGSPVPMASERPASSIQFTHFC
jgi:aryl carrier-like protein